MNDGQREIAQERLVSIIMPAFNCEDFVAEAIESVFNQTYRNWELIIVDDASTDKTPDVVRQYVARDRRVKYHQLTKNMGAAEARNHALEIAQGEFIAYLDNYDIWFPDKLREQVSFMIENNYNFSCTSYDKIDSDGNTLNQVVRPALRSDYEGVLKRCPGNSTVMYNAYRLGKFKIPNIRKRNDYV